MNKFKKTIKETIIWSLWCLLYFGTIVLLVITGF